MIFTTGGIKGGSGKTTFATNLAIYLSSKGRDVLFVDADDQGSAHAFSIQREATTNGNTGYTAIRQSDKGVFLAMGQRITLSVSGLYSVPVLRKNQVH